MIQAARQKKAGKKTGSRKRVNLNFVRMLVMENTPFQERHIITSLQKIQAEYGYLPRAAMDELARLSNIPVAKFYGTATFYSQFYFKPHGKLSIKLCRGTACHVKGVPQILAAVERHLGIQDGETTSDQLYSLETVACLGTCFLSPVMMVGSQYYGQLSSDSAVRILKKISREESSKNKSTRA